MVGRKEHVQTAAQLPIETGNLGLQVRRPLRAHVEPAKRMILPIGKVCALPNEDGLLDAVFGADFLPFHWKRNRLEKSEIESDRHEWHNDHTAVFVVLRERLSILPGIVAERFLALEHEEMIGNVRVELNHAGRVMPLSSDGEKLRRAVVANATSSGPRPKTMFPVNVPAAISAMTGSTGRSPSRDNRTWSGFTIQPSPNMRSVMPRVPARVASASISTVRIARRSINPRIPRTTLFSWPSTSILT